MLKCTSCNREHDQDAKFCLDCGKPVNVTVSTNSANAGGHNDTFDRNLSVWIKIPMIITLLIGAGLLVLALFGLFAEYDPFTPEYLRGF